MRAASCTGASFMPDNASVADWVCAQAIGSVQTMNKATSTVFRFNNRFMPLPPCNVSGLARLDQRQVGQNILQVLGLELVEYADHFHFVM